MDFNEWKNKADLEIEIVAKLLGKELSTDANELENQVRKIEVYNYRLAELCVQAEYWLSLCRSQNLDKCEGTVFESEIKMDDLTKIEQMMYKKLSYLVGDRNREGIINKRISLAQSFLRGHIARIQSLGE